MNKRILDSIHIIIIQAINTHASVKGIIRLDLESVKKFIHAYEFKTIIEHFKEI